MTPDPAAVVRDLEALLAEALHEYPDNLDADDLAAWMRAHKWGEGNWIDLARATLALAEVLAAPMRVRVKDDSGDWSEVPTLGPMQLESLREAPAAVAEKLEGRP